MSPALRLGTRGSRLALAQSRSVAEALTAASGLEVDLVEITTFGDTSDEPLATIGGTGVFVSALREALLAGEVDFAVHSLKDLPTGAAEGLTLAAVPPRADPRDVLCARDHLTLGELPPGSKIGTGSPRRAAQLRALGLDLEVVPVRGNVDTRLSKVADGILDGVVLAHAGLSRLGLLDAVTEVLDPIQVLPAPGQGALAVECRSTDTELIDKIAVLDDPMTRLAVTAERVVLARLEAGCSAPVGAYAVTAEGEDTQDEELSGTPEASRATSETAGSAVFMELYIRGAVVSDDGAVTIRKSVTGPVGEAEQLGRALAQEMLDDGAGTVVGAEMPAPKKENVS
ncbi:hydroxymethylbilane synthase [Phytoactinopolyspora mesophila]|uniref:Porphobilinogen deaminase n=1 Tax=Phytoactinopolyspora mesophila TaxID=2650750 RepID=A0A7K3M3U9_9ACTN|nr:hydroxymethylbilane synthase [Phytoactinopolyspora mesophila]NDL57717.1 hydroxymethylbilane synthase [Phytoactinopolyspora mesophila]